MFRKILNLFSHNTITPAKKSIIDQLRKLWREAWEECDHTWFTHGESRKFTLKRKLSYAPMHIDESFHNLYLIEMIDEFIEKLEISDCDVRTFINAYIQSLKNSLDNSKSSKEISEYVLKHHETEFGIVGRHWLYLLHNKVTLHFIKELESLEIY